MLKSSETVNALVKTREVIPNARHWCKGVSTRGRQHCILGALGSVLGIRISDQRVRIISILNDCASRLYPDLIDPTSTNTSGRVVSFNDHPKTRHKDVLRVIDEAIATAE